MFHFQILKNAIEIQRSCIEVFRQKPFTRSDT